MLNYTLLTAFSSELSLMLGCWRTGTRPRRRKWYRLVVVHCFIALSVFSLHMRKDCRIPPILQRLSDATILFFGIVVDKVALERSFSECLSHTAHLHSTAAPYALIIIPWALCSLDSDTKKTKLNSVAWVRERTIPNEWSPLVGEVRACFWGQRASRGQSDGFLRPYSRLSRPEPLLFLPGSSSVVLMRLSGACSRPTTQKIW
jgi:hypothetical protein